MASQNIVYTEDAKTGPEALGRVANVIRPGISSEEAQQQYDSWNAHYEKDMAKIIYNAPEIVADHLAEYLGDKKDAKIVDACAGTGRTGMRLHKLGYTNITALDGNANMLEQAKKKNIYKDYICAWMGNVRLPIPDDTFDGLCMSGAFYEGHLKPDCLLEFIRIVKPGGYIVLGAPELNLLIVEAYRNKLEPEMKFLEDKGLWKMMLRKVVPKYIEGMEAGVIFCFQLLEGKRIIGTSGLVK